MDALSLCQCFRLCVPQDPFPVSLVRDILCDHFRSFDVIILNSIFNSPTDIIRGANLMLSRLWSARCLLSFEVVHYGMPKRKNQNVKILTKTTVLNQENIFKSRK